MQIAQKNRHKNKTDIHDKLKDRRVRIGSLVGVNLKQSKLTV